MRRLVATSVWLVSVASCSSQEPPPSLVPITRLEAQARVIGAGQVHADAVGPIIQFGAGVAGGVPFVFSTFETESSALAAGGPIDPASRCVAIEYADIRAAGCIPLDELPDDDFFSRLQGGGACEAANPEAGLIPSSVRAMWVELEGGGTLPATVVDLEPLAQGSAYFFFLPEGVDATAFVAADTNGDVIERKELENSTCLP